MSWQINYAIKNIRENHGVDSAKHLRGDAVAITLPHRDPAVVIVTAAHSINAELAMKYHAESPDMDFLCGYRKECVWEGNAIKYLETNSIGWGNAGTLHTALYNDNLSDASHKDYSFSYRLIRQMRSIKLLERQLDRIFIMTLASGQSFRVGMIMEYEPTADAIRSFWDRFGPIDIAWNINPNGNPTMNAIAAGMDLGCKVMKWEELKALL